MVLTRVGECGEIERGRYAPVKEAAESVSKSPERIGMKEA